MGVNIQNRIQYFKRERTENWTTDEQEAGSNRSYPE